MWLTPNTKSTSNGKNENQTLQQEVQLDLLPVVHLLCSEGRSTLRWESRAVGGSDSGCGTTRGRSRSTAALLHPYKPCRTPCGGRPLPSLLSHRCPLLLLRRPLWLPTGCPPSPGVRRKRKLTTNPPDSSI